MDLDQLKLKIRENLTNGSRLADDVFIAEGVRINGDVRIGEGSSVWYNCVLRGDVDKIIIGKRSNIQDGSVIQTRA